MEMEKNCIQFMKNKKKDSPALQFKKYLKMKMRHKEKAPMLYPGEDPAQHVYDEFYEAMMKHIIKGVPQQELAAIILAIAVRLYRTVLMDDDFNEMIEHVQETANNVQPFFDDRTIN